MPITLIGASTSTFLDAHVADPEAGFLHGPIMMPGGTDIIIKPLSPVNSSSYLSGSLFPAVNDAIALQGRAARFGHADSYPVVATEGQWSLMEIDETEPLRVATLVSAGRRLVSLGLMIGGQTGHFVRVGWRGFQAELYQEFFVDSHKNLRPGGYYFRFHEETLRGLRLYLDLPEAPAHEVALAVVNAIHASEQYSQGDQSGPPRVGAGKEWRDLVQQSTRGWRLPEEVISPFDLMQGGGVLTFDLPARDRLSTADGEIASLARVLWEREEEHDYLTIYLYPDLTAWSQGSMPLADPLRRMLWECGLFYVFD